jgi:diguanylate cyclase (GGDEF)-like protein
MYAIWVAQQRKLLREAAYARELEEQVAARTEELAERNAELQGANEQLRLASVTDPLTGLANRRGLSEHILALVGTEGISTVTHTDMPGFTLLVIDLDHLKPINDRYGHDGGDRLLKQIAEILRGLCRPGDEVVRWGGDEFVLLVRDPSLDNAAVLAERVRATVAKKIFRVGEGVVARTTCSIGFAPYPFIASAPWRLDWEQSLTLADAALYQAKRDRNTWVGWAGTARTAELATPAQDAERDAAALEAGGYLRVARRTHDGEDFLDTSRIQRSPIDR